MTRLLKMIFSVVCLVAITQADAQQRLVYTLPAADRVTTQKNIEYRKVSDRTLKFDFYRLPASEKAASLPVVIMVNTGFNPPDFKDSIYQAGWAKLIASSGLAAVTYQAHGEGWAEDFDALVSHLREHKASLGIDADTIIVYAASGNVMAGLPLAMDKKRTFIKAAVFYYGVADVNEFRLDMPVLLVRAGLDQPSLNRHLGEFISRAMAANVPLEVINYPGGHHPFEVEDDNDFSREVMARTIEFMHRSVSSGAQQAIRAGLDEAGASAAMLMENWTAAVASYESLVAKQPRNFETHRRLADALFGAKQYARAVEEYEQSYSLGHWRKRDISYPASVACVRVGDVEGALKWIGRLIRTPFDRASLRTDSNFEPLRDNPRFNALIDGKNQ